MGKITRAELAERGRARRRLPPPSVRRRIRVRSSASQADVAALLGVHRETLSRWERGVRDPSGRQLVAYVALLEELQSDD